MITDRRLMRPFTVVLDHVRVDMDWEPELVRQFDNWRADRQVFGRAQAVQMMIRWVAAHDDTGRQRPVQPTDPILRQLDAIKDARGLIARTEAVKQTVLRVLRQPFPVGNMRRKRPVKPSPTASRGVPRLVVDNAERREG